MKTDSELFTIGAAIQRGEPNPLTPSEKKEIQDAIDRDNDFITRMPLRKISTRGFYDALQSQAAYTKDLIQKAKNRIKFYSFFIEN